MAMLDWNLGGKKTAISGLTPQEQEDIDAQIETANRDAFVPPNVELQFSPATPTKGLTRREQTVAESRSPSETLRLREEQRRDDWHKSNMKARQRRLEGMLATEGGRYSPITIRRAQEELDRLQGGGIPGLRAHELAVADKGIEQERVKAWGMANQGGVAAGIKAGVERDASRSQHGYFDDNGNYVPGSTVRAAEATGLLKSELNENNWRNRKAIKEMDEEGKNNRKQKDLDFKEKELNNNNEQKGYDRDAKKGAAEERTRRIKERQAQQAALREQKGFEKFMTDVDSYNVDLSPEERKALKAMSPDEQKAFWKKKYGREDQQNNGAPAAGGKPKEGDRRETANGMAVLRNGKWVLETK